MNIVVGWSESNRQNKYLMLMFGYFDNSGSVQNLPHNKKAHR